MRSLPIVLLASLAACAPSLRAAEPRGATRFEYRGGVEVVFTNATPATMCGLYMSDDALLDYGDNWLDARGLPSGQSIVLRVRPGTYKARWETCPQKGAVPGFAAALWRETGFEIERETQLYAYVAEATPPTQRAPMLDRVRVMFQGQAVVPGSAQEPQIAHRTSPVAEPAAPEKMSFADYVEKPAPGTKKR